MIQIKGNQQTPVACSTWALHHVTLQTSPIFYQNYKNVVIIIRFINAEPNHSLNQYQMSCSPF